jgi:hypothetical protein
LEQGCSCIVATPTTTVSRTITVTVTEYGRIPVLPETTVTVSTTTTPTQTETVTVTLSDLDEFNLVFGPLPTNCNIDLFNTAVSDWYDSYAKADVEYSSSGYPSYSLQLEECATNCVTTSNLLQLL